MILINLNFRLREIRRRGLDEDNRAQQEDEWVKRMEENAMKVITKKI